MTTKNHKRITGYMTRLKIPRGMAKGIVAADRAGRLEGKGQRRLRRRDKHLTEAHRLCARVLNGMPDHE